MTAPEIIDTPETASPYGTDPEYAEPDEPVVGAEPTPITFPDDWPRPSVTVQRDLDAAADAAKVPRAIVHAIARRESTFNPRKRGTVHAGNSDRFAKSYAAYKDRTIPGSKLTWGQMFTRPEDWTAHGLMMLLPFNIVGKAGGVKPGAPVADLLQSAPNARRGAKMIADAYEKHGDWAKAIRAYNNSSVYVREVLALAKELGWEPTATVVGDSL